MAKKLKLTTEGKHLPEGYNWELKTSQIDTDALCHDVKDLLDEMGIEALSVTVAQTPGFAAYLSVQHSEEPRSANFDGAPDQLTVAEKDYDKKTKAIMDALDGETFCGKYRLEYQGTHDDETVFFVGLDVGDGQGDLHAESITKLTDKVIEGASFKDIFTQLKEK